MELVEVYTMAGIPTVALNESCGYLDTQPPQEAKVCGSHCGGVAVVWPWCGVAVVWCGVVWTWCGVAVVWCGRGGSDMG